MAKKESVEKKWWILDVENKVLGRVASKLATILSGKSKPIYTPHVDTGDFVVVVNADKINLTGKKFQDKVYYSHTGFTGGIKKITASKLLDKNPEEILRKAVKGMLPKNKLSRDMLSKLKIYKGTEHPHSAQQPEKLEI